jgi:hypothetical protein
MFLQMWMGQWCKCCVLRLVLDYYLGYCSFSSKGFTTYNISSNMYMNKYLFFSLLSLFKKNRSRLIRSRCCVCVCVCVSVCLCIPLSLLGNSLVKAPLSLLGNGSVKIPLSLLGNGSVKIPLSLLGNGSVESLLR